ncbi:MAG: TlyA family RNA methyltransferase [Propionibacteriaceae bacterium]|nr:TlyA family RNA methyltransferase [Propionibacteriaceae bacterium]
MRLDQALVARGLARSRTQAARLIAEGRVQVAGATATKPSQPVTESEPVTAEPEPWVSRAAHKLLGALADSGTRLRGRVLDAGASTGGFTQVALSEGATRVYAVDVGHDQLAAQLRDDPRVLVREGLNLRHLQLSDVEDEPVDTIVGDVSFISLRLLLASLLAVLAPTGQALLLVKPQFEVGRPGLSAGGVVRDAALQQAAVAAVIAEAEVLGWRCNWQGPSRLPGAQGNQEFFIRLCAASGR